MKSVSYVALVVAAVALIVGLISRLTMTPIAAIPDGPLTAEMFLGFANTCLLVSIAVSLLEMLKK
jgi:hypothetical protein